MKYFVYIVIVIVAITVIAGFFLVGTPGKERLRRFDDKRVSDLQILQSEIVNYWQDKGKLPTKLAELADPIRGTIIPKDPQTGVDYEYNIKDPETFELCTIFNLESIQNKIQPVLAPNEITPPPYRYFEGSWQHQAGKTCFERKIDKDIYKPLKK